MTVQGNGNMLIGKAYTAGCPNMSTDLLSYTPSKDFDMIQYFNFLHYGSAKELETDTVTASTWRLIKWAE